MPTALALSSYNDIIIIKLSNCSLVIVAYISIILN